MNADSSAHAGSEVHDYDSAVRKEGDTYVQNGTATMIDVSKNPGFAVHAATPEEKIQRNLRIAKYIATGLFEVPKKGWVHFITDYGGLLPTSTTVIVGYARPPRMPLHRKEGQIVHSKATSKYADVPFIQKELAVFLNTYPDWGGMPDGFSARPFPEGVMFTCDYQGTSKKTGRVDTMWETYTLLINEDGFITHSEFAQDTEGMNVLYKELYGKTTHEIGRGPDFLEKLVKLVDEALEAQGGPPPSMTFESPFA